MPQDRIAVPPCRQSAPMSLPPAVASPTILAILEYVPKAAQPVESAQLSHLLAAVLKPLSRSRNSRPAFLDTGPLLQDEYLSRWEQYFELSEHKQKPDVRLPPWTGSWTGSAQNPSAVSAICAIDGGIVAASGSAAGEHAPRNASLLVSQPGLAELRCSRDQGGACGAAGPAPAPPSGLGGPGRRTPGHRRRPRT